MPFIFAGSVKSNLDPYGDFDEKRIMQVLDEVQLGDFVRTLPFGLETDLSVNKAVFSVGQT